MVVSLYLSWEKKKRKSHLDSTFFYYQRFSRISQRKYDIIKSAVYHKWCEQLDNLFRMIVTNTSNSHQFWRIRSACAIKVGCTFWACQMHPFNSEIGPVIFVSLCLVYQYLPDFHSLFWPRFTVVVLVITVKWYFKKCRWTKQSNKEAYLNMV